MHVLGMLGNAHDERIQGNLDFDPSRAEKALFDQSGELTLSARPNAPQPRQETQGATKNQNDEERNN